MTLSKECPVCSGSGRLRPAVFSADEGDCKNCAGTGKVQVEQDVKRRYVCEVCRTGFESDFTVDPATLSQMTRSCPSCSGRAFLTLETVVDVVRALAVLAVLELKE